MKVINIGRKPTMRVICEYCNSELEITREDLTTIVCGGYIPDEMYGDADDNFRKNFTCPICSKVNSLLPSQTAKLFE